MKNVALITGGTSGIGRALAEIHASAGRDLVIVAEDEAALETTERELAERHDVGIETLHCDLSQHDAAQQVYAFVQNKGITVDYLMNNAGFGGQGYFHERELAQDQAMINLNVSTVVQLTRLFLPGMLERNQGKILNVASSAGMVPGGPLQSVYYATKAFVLSFSLGLAGELADTNVTVTALCPGATQTGFVKRSGLEGTSLFRNPPGTPEHVARDAYRAMEHGKLVQLTALPWHQRLLLLFVPLIPKRFFLAQVRTMQEV